MTSDSVKFIIRCNFGTDEFQPDNAIALLSASGEFFEELSSASALSTSDKQPLLWVKNKILQGKDCCGGDYPANYLKNISDSLQWLPKQTFSAFVKESEVASLTFLKINPN